MLSALNDNSLNLVGNIECLFFAIYRKIGYEPVFLKLLFPLLIFYISLVPLCTYLRV